VVVAGVAKLFHRGERHDSLRDLIPSVVRRLRGRGRPAAAPARAATTFWAVRDLSFEVEFGRALGIIGPNGAGKSTTLKLLTGILRPTRGEIRMRGRVASLIEVSAGFHQDLTGRENVYLQGAIMGLTRREVAQRLASIVDFSGIEAFIDTPVKRYSSGMNARLGFAIAVHLEPDVLVIDEVLSVGDMAFQTKCVERMQAFKRDGVAIVFVSHNMQAVGELCDEALVIKGYPRFRGPVHEAVREYVTLSASATSTLPDRGVAVTGARLSNAAGEQVDRAGPHDPLTFDVDVRFDRPVDEYTFCFQVQRASDDLMIYDAHISSAELGLGPARAGDVLHLSFDHDAHLARGQYTYGFAINDHAEGRPVVHVMSLATVRIDEYRTYAGLADLDVRARVRPTLPSAARATAGGTAR
jgi:ABC-type polysaccharide/polyol phosphate transport system ATPase subunit